MDRNKIPPNYSQIMLSSISIIIIVIALVYLALFNSPAELSITPEPHDHDSVHIDMVCDVSTTHSIDWNFSNGYAGSAQSDPGMVFLVLNLTIRNHGYEEFSTNPYYFDLIADSVQYGFHNCTWSIDNWDLLSMRNGETFNGTLIFQVPENTQSIKMDYTREHHEYLVVWTEA